MEAEGSSDNSIRGTEVDVVGLPQVSAEASKKRKVEPTVEVLVTKPPVKKTTVTRPAQVKVWHELRPSPSCSATP